MPHAISMEVVGKAGLDKVELVAVPGKLEVSTAAKEVLGKAGAPVPLGREELPADKRRLITLAAC